MTIRRVKKGDELALKRIAVEILEPLYGSQDKAYNEWLTGNGFKHAFVAVDQDEVAGFLSLKANPDKPYLKISTLVILPEYVSNGLGKKLLAKAEGFAREEGYNSIIVTVSESVKESIDFFNKHDFKIIEQKDSLYREGVAELIMEKVI